MQIQTKQKNQKDQIYVTYGNKVSNWESLVDVKDFIDSSIVFFFPNPK